MKENLKEALASIMEEGSVEEWLNKPNLRFDNLTPQALIDDGREDVIGV